MADRIYITEKDKITKEENNLVTVTLEDGRVLSSLEPRRLFPVSSLDTYITLLDTDGKEAALIRSLASLSADSRATVEASLDDYYLVPHITRIISSDEKYGTLRWVVETDRGVKGFDIRNRNHDIKVYKDGRVRVRDSDDNRYVIDNFRALDSQSRSKLIADL
jgi:hypothetical protein